MVSFSQAWVLSTKAFLSGLKSALSTKCAADPFTCSSDPALEKSFDFSQAPLDLQPQSIGVAVVSKRPDDSLDASYDFFAAQQPTSPLSAAREELAMLDGQAQQLRATITRRKRVDGANCTGDNVSGIVSHYQGILDDLQPRIAELNQFIREYESQSDLMNLIREDESRRVANLTLDKFQPRLPMNGPGNKMTSIDYQRILDEPIVEAPHSSRL